jgi:hypothetical protein
MSNPLKRPRDTCDPQHVFREQRSSSTRWGLPGSRTATYRPLMPRPDTTTSLQPQREIACALTRSAKEPQLSLYPSTTCRAASMIAPAQQLGFLGYLPDEDTVTSSSNPEDPNAHQDDLIRYHAQSQVLNPVTTPAGYDGPGPTLGFDEASSGVRNDQTLPEFDTDTHKTEQPIAQTVAPKYKVGLDTDYCCSYKSAGPGSRIYSYYTAVPQKGYKTVILTLWADHYEYCATIGFSVAPVFPCEVGFDKITGVPTINYHGWDQAQNRDKAFDAANRLFRWLHSDLSL